MGTYTTQEFLDMFGALPDRDDPDWAGPDPDSLREFAEEIDALSRAALAPAPAESEKEA